MDELSPRHGTPLVLIRYTPHDPSERAATEQRLSAAIRSALGPRVAVRFEELPEHAWKRSEVRLWGHFGTSKADVFAAVSACMSEQAGAA